MILKEDLPWEENVSRFYKIKCVVYPEPDQSAWCVEFARDDLGDYSTNRGAFPENWRGLRDKELQDVSGIKDAIFCHRGGFVAIAKTKESAIEMARKTLEN